MTNRRRRTYAVAALGSGLLTLVLAMDVGLRRSVRVGIATFLAGRTDPVPGYAPNEDVRRRFARLEPEEVERATVNGFRLTKEETDAAIASLRLSQRRAPTRVRPSPLDEGQDGLLEFDRWLGSGHEHQLNVRFSNRDPSCHHGPAFAQAIREALIRSDYDHQIEASKG